MEIDFKIAKIINKYYKPIRFSVTNFNRFVRWNKELYFSQLVSKNHKFSLSTEYGHKKENSEKT